MNRQTLGTAAGAPPGGSVGPLASPPGDAVYERASGWRAVVRVLRSPSGLSRLLANDLVTTVFPADCRVCGGPLLRAGMVPVCDPCAGELTLQTGTMCGRCGEALGLDLEFEPNPSSYEDQRFLAGMLPEGVLCHGCRTAPPRFEQAVAYGVYRDGLREMVHLLKFERVSALAGPLGAKLVEAIRKIEHVADRRLTVVAVPLFPARQAERGYNQSVLLADVAIQLLKKKVPAWQLTAAHDALRRTRHTESQYSLSAKGRHANLRGAFEADKAVFAGKEVLLIDDIYTTGATAGECARVLRRAGAARVWVATLARAQVERAGARAEPEEAVAMWSN